MAPFSAQLMNWYDQHKRQLPWRDSHDPYAIMVSESMLQQTQVATVIPYFRRFMKAFPSFAALAAASEADVLLKWEGLGYYRRAKYLRCAAQVITEKFAGRCPESAYELQQLPGIGPYASAAIASIAFGQSVACVDGNIARVIARLDGLDDDIQSSRTKARLQRRAGELLAPDRPGDHNQAMMELGATRCTPRNPNCDHCPVRSHCVTVSRGEDPHSRPHKPKRIKIRRETYPVVLIKRGERQLMAQRADGLLGGLWEYPSTAVLAGTTRLNKLGEIRQKYSHIDATYELYRASVSTTWAPAPNPLHTAYRWVEPSSLNELACTGAFHKLHQMAQALAASPS